MSAALDMGSMEFRSLRRDQNRLIAKRVPARYCVFEDNLHHRALLGQARIPYSRTNDSIVTVGSDAIRISSLTGSPLVPIFPSLRSPRLDPFSRQLCANLIQSIVTQARIGSGCSICLPAFVSRSCPEIRRNVENILNLIGYRGHQLNPASALAISEFGHRQLTGIAFVLGAESISMSIIDVGRIVLESDFLRGFQRVEESFASRFHHYLWDQSGRRSYNLHAMNDWLKSSEINLSSPQTGEEKWLADQLRDLINGAWSGSLPRLLRVSGDRVFLKSLPMIVSGGPVHLPGLTDILGQVIQQSRFPLQIQEIVPSIFTPYAVARGLLIHAELIDSGIQMNSAA